MARAGKRKSRRDANQVDGVLLDTRVSVTRHPRARRSVRVIKAWAALIVGGLVLWRADRAGLAFDQSLARALLAGVVAYLVAWLAAVVVWRQLILAELDDYRRRVIERLEAEAAAAAEERAAAEAAAGEPTPSFG